MIEADIERNHAGGGYHFQRKAATERVADRLRRSMPLRLPRDGETCPSRPLDARKTSVTSLFSLQVMPSHVQQSMPFRHEEVSPPSCDSPVRKWSRKILSCSVHALDKESNSTRARVNEGMAILPP